MYCYTHGNCIESSDAQVRFTDNKLLLHRIIKEKLKNTNAFTPFYKILHPSAVSELIDPYLMIANQIRENFTEVLIIAMGGASLNPQALLALSGAGATKPRIQFLNNTDPFYLKGIIDRLELKDTICIIISSSGETLETIAITKTLLEYFKKAEIKNYRNNFLFITGVGTNSLRRLANEINSRIYDHAYEVSGRYAGLTNITALPALIAGVNYEQFLQGAISTIENFWAQEEESTAAQAAIILATVDRPIIINLGYLQSFAPFLEWYSQIIAESLGKNTLGYTPVKGLGPNDQHSMVQLYLEGRKDKVFTLFYIAETGVRSNTPELFKVNTICFQATKQALEDKKLPLRTLILEDLSEKSIGSLMAHCMLEIILLGKLLKINPFDQPGVELVKSHARSLCREFNIFH